MLLDNSIHFSHRSEMNFTYDIFMKYFSNSIKLNKFSYSENSMGYFMLEYKFSPKNYTLKFEAENLFISIRVLKGKNMFTSIAQLEPDKTKDKNHLNFSDIEYLIKTLYEVLISDKEFFYCVQNNKLTLCE